MGKKKRKRKKMDELACYILSDRIAIEVPLYYNQNSG
jgi:hypothetical protein